jgi:hypothetical protein
MGNTTNSRDVIEKRMAEISKLLQAKYQLNVLKFTPLNNFQDICKYLTETNSVRVSGYVHNLLIKINRLYLKITTDVDPLFFKHFKDILELCDELEDCLTGDTNKSSWLSNPNPFIVWGLMGMIFLALKYHKEIETYFNR